ncbi:MAG: branched-chain amino acid ABC transporter permease [Chloroflexi bacterium]|nr:branched-chain amino acid ABC transporter permease [Chloroflexota bacterium]
MKNRSSIKYALVVLASLVLLAFPLVAPNRYVVHIVNMAGLYILLSLGLNIAMGYCGQINLALGAFWGVGAYTAAILNTRLGMPIWINLPVGMVLSGIVGALIALPMLKVRSHYLALVTIGLAETINIIMVNETWLTEGPLGISGIQMPNLFGIPIDGDERFYYLVLACVVIGYLVARQIVGHRIGRSFVAIRDDYVAAKAMGVNTAYYQVLANAIAAVYCGVSGVLYAHMNTYISPDIFEFKSALFVLTMTMIGGMGSLAGSVVGGLGLPLTQEWLRAIGNWQLVGFGLAIMIIVLFVPGGVVGLTRRIEERGGITWPWARKPTAESLQTGEPNVTGD